MNAIIRPNNNDLSTTVLGDAWQSAAAAWLRTKTGRTGSDNTRRAYERVLNDWLDFLGSVGRNPGQAGGVEIEAYRQEMASKGSASSTIAQRLAVISSFYKYCRDKFTLQNQSGQEITLINYNPADRTDRPKIEAFSNSQKLPVETLPKLLQLPNRSTLQGKRDYSILVTYLMTGRRLAELARLTWRDLYFAGDTVFYTYIGKGNKKRTRQLPPPAWSAISEYLAGREIKEDSPIWIAHSEAGKNLPNVGSNGNSGLSMAMIRRLVNRYTRKAFGKAVSPHALRHSAAALRKRAGDDPRAIQEFLDHSNLATTAGYLEKLDPGKDSSWQAAANLLGV